MKSIFRRIEALEKRLMPQPLTARDRELLGRIEAGRERVRKMREKEGLPPDPDWGLPPKRIHTSHGVQLIIDILHEGRERAAASPWRHLGAPYRPDRSLGISYGMRSPEPEFGAWAAAPPICSDTV
jgi:hypothetical protein